ncbi:MAG TPA: AMP-binding protein [Thermoanaerobaculaceae bacterium]|nr:AMP-binding protein [Thermoanaerobaculaceae bacterium]
MPEAPSPIIRHFLTLARTRPGLPALLGPEGEILATRGALAAGIQAQRERLAPLLGPGSTVVLSLPNGPDFVRAFSALRLLGARVALADASAPIDELQRAAAAVGADFLVATPERLARSQLVLADGSLALAARRKPEPVGLPPGTAILKLTSGSTGLPRAVAISERQLAADTVQILRTMGVRTDDVTMAAIPLTHSYGIGSCLVPLLLAGAPLAFPTWGLPAALAHTLARARVAHFPAVPAMIRTLATLPDLPELPDLRVCLAAGAPLAPEDGEAFRAATGHKVHIFYGCSECGGITYDRSAEPVHEAGAVGTAMERVTVTVVDEEGRALPNEVEGRVLVASRAVALGAVPPPDEPGELAPGRFLSGDLGILDGGGRLRLTGRVAEFLNVAGKKVHPEEVRRVLEALPGVRSAAVAGLPDPHRGQLVAALVAVEPATNITVHAVLAACRERLAPHKVPRRIVIVDELPVSERGKVRKEVVMQLLTGSDQARDAS